MAGDKIIVLDPYYATQCEHCGWIGSSELCGEIRYDDDADVTCPTCRQSICGDPPDERFLDRFAFVGGE